MKTAPLFLMIVALAGSPETSRAFSCQKLRNHLGKHPELKACLEHQALGEFCETEDEVNISEEPVGCEELMAVHGDINPEKVRRFKQCEKERLARQIYDGHIRPVETTPRFP